MVGVCWGYLLLFDGMEHVVFGELVDLYAIAVVILFVILIIVRLISMFLIMIAIIV